MREVVYASTPIFSEDSEEVDVDVDDAPMSICQWPSATWSSSRCLWRAHRRCAGGAGVPLWFVHGTTDTRCRTGPEARGMSTSAPRSSNSSMTCRCPPIYAAYSVVSHLPPTFASAL
jgi:hypothetical protein